MWGLVLVLGALLASAELGGGATQQPDLNLSCYGCFKVTDEALCRPTQCSPEDRVCVSHALLIFLKPRVKTMFSKRCAPRCPNTDTQYRWLLENKVESRVARGCCARSLCNGARASPEGARALQGGLLLLLLPPLGAGVLWALP